MTDQALFSATEICITDTTPGAIEDAVEGSANTQAAPTDALDNGQEGINDNYASEEMVTPGPNTSVVTPVVTNKVIPKSALASGGKSGVKKGVRIMGDDGRELTPLTPVQSAMKMDAAKTAAIGEHGSPVLANRTAKKTGRKRSITEVDDEDDLDQCDEGAENQPTKGKGRFKNGVPPEQRKRKHVQRAPVDRLPVGASWDELAEVDKQLVTMFEAKKPWPEINAMWASHTGNQTQSSTLPNRYQRIKDKLVVMHDEDHIRLLEAKDKVDAELEVEKWERISTIIVEKGGLKYPAHDVKREYNKMMKKGLSDIAMDRG